MANLLKKQTKSNLLWQKRERIIVILTGMSILALALSSAALLPAALYTSIVRSSVEEHTLPQGSGNLSKQRQELTTELRDAKRLLERASTIANMPRVSNALKLSAQHINNIDGVQLSTLSTVGDMESGTYILRLSGTATNRGSVVSVKDVFESDSALKIVDFPIENLTPQRDGYLFSIELEVVEVK